jgi:WD40 repeat protein
MNHHFFQRRVTLALFLSCLWGHLGHGKTIDTQPRPAILLTKSERFIAQDAWNSAALYGFGDAEAIRRFPAGGRINEIEMTADEQLLLVACDNGEIGVWSVGSGKKLWWLKSSQSGLAYIYGACFSWDGRSLVACNERDFVVVFDARTGQRIGVVSFPPMQTNIMSAALSPDGSKGAFVDLGERLFTFDTPTGLMKDTALKGAWPVRYSADGKYLALSSSNSGVDEQLRVVTVKDLSKKDVGQFSHIGHIKPTEDGGFLACARGVRRRFDDNLVEDDNLVATVGVEYRPGPGELKQVWKLAATDAENRTDFDSKRMIGVSTDFRLVTRLIDLRTGKPRLTIDNSANYRETIVSESIVSSTSADFPRAVRFYPWFGMVGGIVALLMLGWLVTYFLKSKRIKSPPGEPFLQPLLQSRHPLGQRVWLVVLEHR